MLRNTDQEDPYGLDKEGKEWGDDNDYPEDEEE